MWEPRGGILNIGDGRIYFSVDTSCTDEMQRLEDIDLALVCMNMPTRCLRKL